MIKHNRFLNTKNDEYNWMTIQEAIKTASGIKNTS